MNSVKTSVTDTIRNGVVTATVVDGILTGVRLHKSSGLLYVSSQSFYLSGVTQIDELIHSLTEVKEKLGEYDEQI